MIVDLLSIPASLRRWRHCLKLNPLTSKDLLGLVNFTALIGAHQICHGCDLRVTLISDAREDSLAQAQSLE